MSFLNDNKKWTRSRRGWFAGVCEGLGRTFDVDPNLIRLLWLGSILFFGVGLFLYILCAFLMPLKGFESKAEQPKVLGVCYRLAEKLDINVVPLRVLCVFVFLGSFGLSFFGYIGLHLLLPYEISEERFRKAKECNQ